MGWVNEVADNKIFWHITGSVQNVLSIIENGIIPSSEGQQGSGVYAIEQDDEVLDSVLELMQQEGRLGEEGGYIVEFTYSGSYSINPKDMLVYSNEGWAIIPSYINKTAIKRIIRLKDNTEL